MDRDELQARTHEFALRVLRLVDALPSKPSGSAIAKQLARSGTSVGANYRAARRARSKREFNAKLSIVVEEIDESLYWLALLRDHGLVPESRLAELIAEADELTRVFATMRAKSRRSE